jgi:WD40 repeat protein
MVFARLARCLVIAVAAALAVLGSLAVASAQGKPPIAVVGSFIDPSRSREVLFLADGRTVAFPDLGLLADATSGLPLRRMNDPVFVTASAFTPDGAVFASGHKDGTIKLWDVATGGVIATLAKPNDDVRIESLWIDGKGELLVSGDHVGVVKVWRLATRRAVLTIELRPNLKGGSDARVVAARLSADGARLIVLARASFPRAGTTFFDPRDVVIEYDARSGAERSASVLPAKHEFLDRGLVDDGDALVLVTADCERGEVKQWNFAAAAMVADVHKPATCDKSKDGGDTDPVRLFSSPQSSRVVIVPGDAPQLMLWDAMARKFEKTVRWPDQASVPDVIGMSQDLAVVAQSDRGAVRLRALETGAPIKEFRSVGPAARNVIARGPGPRILLQREVREGDAASIDLDLRADALAPVALHLPSAVSDLTVHDFSPGAKLALAAGEKGELLLLSLDGPQPARRLEVAGLRDVRRASLSPDGKMALVVGEFGAEDNTESAGALIDTSDGKIRLRFEAGEGDDRITSGAFAGDGARLAIGHYNGKADIWDARTLKRIRALPSAAEDAGITAVSFSPDGRFLVGSGMFDGGVYAWNLATGKVRTFDLGESLASYTFATAVAMSRDGKTLAAGLGQRHTSSGDRGSDRGTIVVWDAATGKRRFTLRSQRGASVALAFAADDRLIVSGSLDGTIQYWDRASGRLMATAMSGASDEWLVLSESGLYAGSDGSDSAVTIVDGRKAVAAVQARAVLRNPSLIEDLLKGDASRYRDAARKLDLSVVLKSANP